MVDPSKQTIRKTSSTSQYVILAVKILFVLLILFLLPKLVQGRRRTKNPPRRVALQARRWRQHCETNVCGAYVTEENLNCVSACLSPACFERVYGEEPLEDGELDFGRARLFDDCYMEESRNAQRRRTKDGAGKLKSV